MFPRLFPTELPLFPEGFRTKGDRSAMLEQSKFGDYSALLFALRNCVRASYLAERERMTKSETPARPASTSAAPPKGIGSPPNVTRELTLALRAVIARVLREPASHPDVEDAVQESLRRVVEGARPAGVALAPWAIGVARHVALDVIRGRQRERARFESVPDEQKELLGVTDERSGTPLDEALSRENAERVRAALTLLPEGQKRAIELFFIEGLSYDEIATRLRVPSGTIAIWLMRAKTTLHASLTEKAK